MCLAQGPQRIDAGAARTHGPLVSSSLPLSHCASVYNFVKILLVVRYMKSATPQDNHNRSSKSGELHSPFYRVIQASLGKIQGLFKDL